MLLNRENIVYSAFTTFREKSFIPSAEASRQGELFNDYYQNWIDNHYGINNHYNHILINIYKLILSGILV